MSEKPKNPSDKIDEGDIVNCGTPKDIFGKKLAKGELGDTPEERYRRFQQLSLDLDNPKCPNCGTLLQPSGTISADGKTTDGRNYRCQYCRANNPSKIRHWHMYFRDKKLEPGNIHSGY